MSREDDEIYTIMNAFDGIYRIVAAIVDHIDNEALSARVKEILLAIKVEQSRIVGDGEI